MNSERDKNMNQGGQQGSQGTTPNREQQNQGDKKPGHLDRDQQHQEGGKSGQQGTDRDRNPGQSR